MTYNGIWNTTDSTCANVGTNAQVASIAFRNPYNSAVYVGYTYNNTVAESTVAMDVNDVFGSNDNIIINNTRAPIKVLIEDTWYASAMAIAEHDYTSLLEAAVGYCNDRSAYDASGNLLAEIVPRENAALWFGSRVRVGDSSVLRSPSLSCPRGDVDNYVYAVGADGLGNTLKYPVVLLTADEISLAGNGTNNILPYTCKSYLCSGSNFWTLSLNIRNSNGAAAEFYLGSSGSLNVNYVTSVNGVRSVISLIPGTYATGGDGSATDLWTING